MSGLEYLGEVGVKKRLSATLPNTAVGSYSTSGQNPPPKPSFSLQTSALMRRPNSRPEIRSVGDCQASSFDAPFLCSYMTKCSAAIWTGLSASEDPRRFDSRHCGNIVAQDGDLQGVLRRVPETSLV